MTSASRREMLASTAFSVLVHVALVASLADTKPDSREDEPGASGESPSSGWSTGPRNTLGIKDARCDTPKP